MPGIDIALVLMAAAAAGLGFRRGDWGPGLRWGFAAAASGVVAWQIANVALHWQVLPAYLAVVAAGLLLFRRERRGSRLLATAALAAGIATLGLLWAVPVFELPLPTGPYAVGTTGPLDWADSSRSRELVAQVWYPAAAGASGARARYARFGELDLRHSYQTAVRTNSVVAAPVAAGEEFPVLIFGHGWGAARMRDTFLVEELASHGYVVVAVDHPGIASRMELSDGRVVKGERAHALDHLESASAAAMEALWADELALWVADDRFALDRLGRLSQFAGKLDLGRVGAFGHSFGGASSIALLGADSRVRCAVDLDGWTLNGIERRTTQPALFLYEQAAEERSPGTDVESELQRTDDAGIDASLAKYGGLRAYVAGTQHADFTDQTLLSPLKRLTSTGPIPGERVRTITRALVLGFFDQTLLGRGEVPAFPEVKMQRWAPQR